jgi:2-amino-4-hydroxy-6-hydroxymethyldihydropteridine diphosphokinase
MSSAYFAFGANLGDRERNIAAALRAIEDLATIDSVSALYETDPVPAGQPVYLNAACRASTDLSPQDLLSRLKDIERAIGRRGGERWGPRPIDIDLLSYGDLQLDQDDLHLPHEGLAERAFVLVPLAEIAGEVRLPGFDAAIQSLAASIDRSGVRVYRDAGWARPA